MAQRRARYRTGNEQLDQQIADLVAAAGADRDADLVFEMVVSAIRMGREAADRGDLKLVNAALKELRYSVLVFEPYTDVRKVAMFGSARTRVDDPGYLMARDFGAAIGARDWMIITGAGPGIMEAGIEGAGADRAFGVNIVLPFESEAAPVIAQDPKLINYRYFFTRKLTFLKESHGAVLLPGGFGTMDEAFELLTLVQTGRSNLIPVVLLEPPGATYWQGWQSFVERELVERELISRHDLDLVRICDNVDDAVEEICGFYRVLHSTRFVGRRLVLRLNVGISDGLLDALNQEFGDIVVKGAIERVAVSASELDDGDVPGLPRIAFHFDRTHYARLRHLVDRLNAAGP
ncbi:MAG: LOG family protein [Actinobacteria bacterium]|nr:LOG family protein [Actinomycetota bacterium]